METDGLCHDLAHLCELFTCRIRRVHVLIFIIMAVLWQKYFVDYENVLCSFWQFTSLQCC